MKKTHKGDLIITPENQNNFKDVTEVSGYIDISENAQADFPALQTSGNIYISENAQADFPALQTSGYIYISENAQADFGKILKSKNNIAKFGNRDYKIIHNDNIPFVVENEKTSKGIKIYSGFLKIKLENKKVVIVEKGFVVEKEGFSAHGSTVKTAIGDLQFKIVAERLKKEPITEDTEITVMYYRTVIGACDLGCRDFMDKNNIPYKIENDRTIEENPMKAKDLLPLLEKSNAYGVSKFKELISFK